MRPSDEEILKQEEAIRMEIKGQTPLIGPLEPIELLQDDYKEGNEKIYNKLLQLEAHQVRRVRGDGNCFFRAISYELIKQTPANARAALLNNINESYQQVSFDKMATDDFLEEFKGQLSNSQNLEEEWQKDEGCSHAVVVVLRLLTSAYLRLHSKDYEPFLCDYTDMTSYCQNQVECIGIESEQIHITALSKALGAHITVYYVDSGSGDNIETIEFTQSTDQSVVPSWSL